MLVRVTRGRDGSRNTTGLLSHREEATDAASRVTELEEHGNCPLAVPPSLHLPCEVALRVVSSSMATLVATALLSLTQLAFKEVVDVETGALALAVGGVGFDCCNEESLTEGRF